MYQTHLKALSVSGMRSKIAVAQTPTTCLLIVYSFNRMFKVEVDM